MATDANRRGSSVWASAGRVDSRHARARANARVRRIAGASPARRRNGSPGARMSLRGERSRPGRSDSEGTPCAPDSALAILKQRSLYPLSRSLGCKHSFAHALRAWARRIAGSGQAERRRACKEPWMTLSCAGRRWGAAIRTPLPARASLPTRATSRERVLWLRIVRALARVRLHAELPFNEARPPAPTICRREGSHPLPCRLTHGPFLGG